MISTVEYTRKSWSSEGSIGAAGYRHHTGSNKPHFTYDFLDELYTIMLKTKIQDASNLCSWEHLGSAGKLEAMYNFFPKLFSLKPLKPTNFRSFFFVLFFVPVEIILQYFLSSILACVREISADLSSKLPAMKTRAFPHFTFCSSSSRLAC